MKKSWTRPVVVEKPAGMEVTAYSSGQALPDTATCSGRARPVLRIPSSRCGGRWRFPQWNVNSEACRRSRLGDVAAPSATQASIAISADGERWFIVNASPDLREQIEASAILQPSDGLRSSPIAGVVLTNADVDAIAGLLHLREGTALALYAPQGCAQNSKGESRVRGRRRDARPAPAARTEAWQSLATAAGEDTGIEVRPFASLERCRSI